MASDPSRQKSFLFSGPVTDEGKFMAWLNREKAPMGKGQRTDTPDGLWEQCTKCNEIILREDYAANQHVCPKCNQHYYIPARSRIDMFLDPKSFVEHDHDLVSPDPLKFNDTKPYDKRLKDLFARTGKFDAIITGTGLLHEMKVEIGVFDFEFLGGSMGSVVGEKISRLYMRSVATKNPAIIFSSSGGARMQEGILSLMQMAKTCAALAKLRDAGVPFISVLTHPTTGGVAASFATLGDLNIGEPVSHETTCTMHFLIIKSSKIQSVFVKVTSTLNDPGSPQ